MKKLNIEWIQAQQTGENRTSKERAGWNTAQQKRNKQKTKRSHTEERKEPYDALQKTEKRSNQKRKKPQETCKKEENDIKEEQVEKGLRTNALRSERNPQSDKNTKQLKQKFASKTALEKSCTKQNKNKQIARQRDRNRETEPELTHFFKNNSFDISLYREFLYTSHFLFMWGVSLASFFCGEFLLHIPRWLYFSVGSFSYTSHACLIFLWGVSLTHPVLPLFFSGEFLLQIPCLLFFFF